MFHSSSFRKRKRKSAQANQINAVIKQATGNPYQEYLNLIEKEGTVYLAIKRRDKSSQEGVLKIGENKKNERIVGPLP